MEHLLCENAIGTLSLKNAVQMFDLSFCEPKNNTQLS